MALRNPFRKVYWCCFSSSHNHWQWQAGRLKDRRKLESKFQTVFAVASQQTAQATVGRLNKERKVA